MNKDTNTMYIQLVDGSIQKVSKQLGKNDDTHNIVMWKKNYGIDLQDEIQKYSKQKQQILEYLGLE